MNEFAQLVHLRMPKKLIAALDTEAQRQMLTRSALIRHVLGRELGLLGKASHTGNAAREEPDYENKKTG